ncbi:MAG: membrane protein insertion efficiency factor YidD [Pseudomonadota bacterium]
MRPTITRPIEPAILKSIFLFAIRFYQRVLSPRKGYCCAYRSHTGNASCSSLGYRAIRRFGVLRGLLMLDARFEKCGIAARRYRPAPRPLALRHQSGSCDPGCDIPGECPAEDCLECEPCDKHRKRKQIGQGRFVPPRRNRPPRHPPA